jgi:hypothetical protein
MCKLRNVFFRSTQLYYLEKDCSTLHAEACFIFKVHIYWFFDVKFHAELIHCCHTRSNVANRLTVDFNRNESFVRQVKKMMKFFRDRKPQGASNDDPYHIPENLAVFDPFKFWAEQNGENLKAIRHMPMILLSIPATSAPSERAFSSAGYIVDKNRNRLLETNVTMLTVVRDHLIRCKSSMQSVH